MISKDFNKLKIDFERHGYICQLDNDENELKVFKQNDLMHPICSFLHWSHEIYFNARIIVPEGNPANYQVLQKITIGHLRELRFNGELIIADDWLAIRPLL
jgi:hypothetical protein